MKALSAYPYIYHPSLRSPYCPQRHKPSPANSQLFYQVVLAMLYSTMARPPRNSSIPAKYSPEQAIPLLKRQLERLEQEIVKLRHNDPEVEAWKQRTVTLLNDAFGQPNGEMHGNTKEFAYATTGRAMRIIPYGGGPNPEELQHGYTVKQQKRAALLKQYIEQLEDDMKLSSPSFSPPQQPVTPQSVVSLPSSEEKAVLNNTKSTVFIGHGHSSLWRELKDFLQDRLKLKYAEFNSESAAGTSTTERLDAMLNNAGFAFLVMTAEDEHADGSVHARDNVIHEAGLFQGRLGFKRAIILREESCQEFSNIHGLTQIVFPKGKISAIFEDVRKVLEREGIK
jgi:predicted nucleotide-binding protein